jgi:hypothetical protein
MESLQLATLPVPLETVRASLELRPNPELRWRLRPVTDTQTDAGPNSACEKFRDIGNEKRAGVDRTDQLPNRR